MFNISYKKIFIVRSSLTAVFTAEGVIKSGLWVWRSIEYWV